MCCNKLYCDNVDDDFEDDGDLGAGQCNHESDAKAIFRFRSEDLPLSQSSHHHYDCDDYQRIYHDVSRKALGTKSTRFIEFFKQ